MIHLIASYPMGYSSLSQKKRLVDPPNMIKQIVSLFTAYANLKPERGGAGHTRSRELNMGKYGCGHGQRNEKYSRVARAVVPDQETARNMDAF